LHFNGAITNSIVTKVVIMSLFKLEFTLDVTHWLLVNKALF